MDYTLQLFVIAGLCMPSAACMTLLEGMSQTGPMDYSGAAHSLPAAPHERRLAEIPRCAFACPEREPGGERLARLFIDSQSAAGLAMYPLPDAACAGARASTPCFVDVAAGDYRLQVSKDRHRLVTVDVTLRAAESQYLLANLERVERRPMKGFGWFGAVVVGLPFLGFAYDGLSSGDRNSGVLALVMSPLVALSVHYLWSSYHPPTDQPVLEHLRWRDEPGGLQGACTTPRIVPAQ